MSATALLFAACVVIALLSVPLILKVVPPNRWYRIRTVQTLSNRDLWFRANRFPGWTFLAAASVSAVALALAPELASVYGALVLVVPIGGALGVSLAYLRRSGMDSGTDH